MSNEEMVKAIQEGNKEYIVPLWNQCENFIGYQADMYLRQFPANYKELRADMINESYFSLVNALESFDPEQGTFISYLAWHLKSGFCKALLGGVTDKKKKDPLNTATSMDVPLYEESDMTISDLIIDETAEACFRRVEDGAFWRNVNQLLNAAIHSIPKGKGKEILLFMLKNNCSIATAAQNLYGDSNVPYYSVGKAIDQVKRHMNKSRIKDQMEKVGLDDVILKGTGLQEYKYNLFTSAVESTAIKRADKMQQNKDILSVIQ